MGGGRKERERSGYFCGDALGWGDISLARPVRILRGTPPSALLYTEGKNRNTSEAFRGGDLTELKRRKKKKTKK
jgi:hypothetical protein